MKKKSPRYNVSCRYTGYVLYIGIPPNNRDNNNVVYARYPHAERPE